MAPVELRAAPFGRQRFGQDEEAVAEVGQRERRRCPERQAQIDPAEKSAERRPDHEAEAECGAEHAEARGALLGRRHVGDVRVRGREARRGRARDATADQQQRQRVDQRHEQEIDADAEVRQQHDRPPAEAIGQRALDRRARELDRREQRAEHADPHRGLRDAAAGKLLDQVRQHRNDDAERQGCRSATVTKMKTRAARRRGAGTSGVVTARLGRIVRGGAHDTASWIGVRRPRSRRTAFESRPVARSGGRRSRHAQLAAWISMKRRNSARVRASSRNVPSIWLVIIDTPRLCTPRVVMHWCTASMTTPTPRGFSTPCDAVRDLRGQLFLHLEAPRVRVDHARELGDADDLVGRQIADVRAADDRRHVMLAERFELDVAQHDHLVVAGDFLERAAAGNRSDRSRSRKTSRGTHRRRAWAYRAGPRAPDPRRPSAAACARRPRPGRWLTVGFFVFFIGVSATLRRRV